MYKKNHLKKNLNMKKILIFCLLFFSFSNAQFTDQINSNRPGKSVMAYSVGKSVVQTEFGINYVNESHKNLEYKTKGYFLEGTFRWGILKEQLEVDADFTYQSDSGTQLNNNFERSGFRQFVIGAKYLLYDPFKNRDSKPNLYSWKANQKFKWNQILPALALYAGANLNFSEGNTFINTEEIDPIISPRVSLIGQNHFGSSWVLVSNLTYNKIGTSFASFDYIITITKGINKNWSAFFENQGYNGKYYSDGIFRLGAAYLLKNDLQFDASFSMNIKDTPQIIYGGIGFSWRFKKNYKDIKLDKPGTKSKMDKKMDKAKKKETEEKKE